jgi:Tol biopolymer transport system component
MRAIPSPFAVRSIEIRYQLVTAALFFVMALPFLAGCTAAGPTPPGSNPDATSPAATAVSLEPGDARLLLARRNGIENVTLSGEATSLVLLEENMRILEMALSPDRSKIAFVVELPAYTNEQGQLDFGADLYVANVDGSDARLLVAHSTVGDYFEAPTWLDESTLLAGWRGFDASGSTSRIERIDAASGTREVVLEDAAMGGLSPDRSAIVYTTIDPETRVQRLVIDELATDDAPRVLVDEFDGLALFSAVAFSPDGSAVAFAAVDLNSAVAPHGPAAPRGASIALSTAGTLTHPFAQDIWLVNPDDGTGLHRIADIAENMPSVSWSGDGSDLFVLGPGFLWRLDPATGEAEMLRQSGERGAIIWLEGG